MRVLRFAAVLLLSFSIAACAPFSVVKQTWDVAKTAVVSKNGITVAVSLSRAAERTGTVYIGQRRCPAGVQRPTCMSPQIRDTIATAMIEMRKARDALLDFVDAHPDQIGDQGLYDALKASTGTLKSIFATYKIGG
jgi:hypothetical protein